MSTTATAADALSRPIAVPAAEPVAVSATDRYAPLREGDTPSHRDHGTVGIREIDAAALRRGT